MGRFVGFGRKARCRRFTYGWGERIRLCLAIPGNTQCEYSKDSNDKKEHKNDDRNNSAVFLPPFTPFHSCTHSTFQRGSSLEWAFTVWSGYIISPIITFVKACAHGYMAFKATFKAMVF